MPCSSLHGNSILPSRTASASLLPAPSLCSPLLSSEPSLWRGLVDTSGKWLVNLSLEAGSRHPPTGVLSLPPPGRRSQMARLCPSLGYLILWGLENPSSSSRLEKTNKTKQYFFLRRVCCMVTSQQAQRAQRSPTHPDIGVGTYGTPSLHVTQASHSAQWSHHRVKAKRVLPWHQPGPCGCPKPPPLNSPS